MAFAPDLALSMTLLLNSAFDELGAPGEHAIDIAVDAVRQMLVRCGLPPQPTPRSLSSYFGSYAMMAGSVNLNQTVVVSAAPQADSLLVLQKTIFGDLLARWVQDDTFALMYLHNATTVSGGLISSCIGVDALALRDELLQFSRDSSSNVNGFTVKGMAFALSWVKKQI